MSLKSVLLEKSVIEKCTVAKKCPQQVWTWKKVSRQSVDTFCRIEESVSNKCPQAMQSSIPTHDISRHMPADPADSNHLQRQLRWLHVSKPPCMSQIVCSSTRPYT